MLLQQYLQTIFQNHPQIARVTLACKQYLIKFYEKAGFKLLGPSTFVHGPDAWFTMALARPVSLPESCSQAVMAHSESSAASACNEASASQTIPSQG